MGEEFKESIEDMSSVSDDSSIALSYISSSGRKKKLNKFEENVPIIDGQKLCDIITVSIVSMLLVNARSNLR